MNINNRDKQQFNGEMSEIKAGYWSLSYIDWFCYFLDFIYWIILSI